MLRGDGRTGGRKRASDSDPPSHSHAGPGMPFGNTLTPTTRPSSLCYIMVSADLLRKCRQSRTLQKHVGGGADHSSGLAREPLDFKVCRGLHFATLRCANKLACDSSACRIHHLSQLVAVSDVRFQIRDQKKSEFQSYRSQAIRMTDIL